MCAVRYAAWRRESPAARGSPQTDEARTTPMMPDLPRTEVAVIEMTNAFRKEHALGPVAADPRLMGAARAFAKHLAATGKFSHEADGRKPHQRAEAQGYRFCFVAENLAVDSNRAGFTERGLATEFLSGWKKSDVHRGNLLMPGATDIGIGVAKVPDHPGRYVSVQMLARPESRRVAFTIENKAGFPVEYRVTGKGRTLGENKSITFRSCNPVALTFPAGARVEYEPGNGETFTLRAAGSERVIVERK